MRSAELRALPDDTYVTVRFSDGEEETTRLLGVREPSQKELLHGHTSNRVDIRRFLTGGWLDTWVYPRDVIAVADPDVRILRMIEYVQTEIGPKPERSAT